MLQFYNAAQQDCTRDSVLLYYIVFYSNFSVLFSQPLDPDMTVTIGLKYSGVQLCILKGELTLLLYHFPGLCDAFPVCSCFKAGYLLLC